MHFSKPKFQYYYNVYRRNLLNIHSLFCSLAVTFKLIPSSGVKTNPFELNFSICFVVWVKWNWLFFNIMNSPILVCILASLSPMHIRGPSPNGMYGISIKLLSLMFSLKNLSGLNWSGSGKYFGSFWMPSTGIKIAVPFSMQIFDPGMWNSLVHSRFNIGTVGYFRRVSVYKHYSFIEFDFFGVECSDLPSIQASKYFMSDIDS